MPNRHPFRYIFGPVPSRRLGRSLGVDLTPHKTCSFDCVFCQLGAGFDTTVARGECVSLRDVQEELTRWLREDGEADWITLSGSGEPTLHAGFGDLIEFAREQSALPVALLSNGSLFSEPAVRASAAKANLVKVSLSAWDAASFARVNRPHSSLDFDAIVQGYREFRSGFSGTLWVEVFLVPGLNTRPQDVQRIAALVRSLHPDSVQLNTAVRPPAETFVQPAGPDELRNLAALFDPPAEIIARFQSGPAPASRHELAGETVLALLRRHPDTAENIAAMAGRPLPDVLPVLQSLLDDGKARIETVAGQPLYRANAKAASGA